MTEQDQMKKRLFNLIRLVDDPDEEVYATVARELQTIGVAAIQPLESLWEVTQDTQIQKRIESIIHHLQFEDLCERWKAWYEQKGTVLDALILIARYKYPELDEKQVRKQYQKLKQDIWLELNPYLTPLEQINVINSIVYNFYNFSGSEIFKSKEQHFYINKLFETKKGNSYSIGSLLSAILEELDVPLKCIQLPHQFLLGYFETFHPFFKTGEEESVMKLTCYVDPNNGYVYAQRDIDNYFQKIGEEAKSEYFLPLTTDQLIYVLLSEIQYFMEQYGDYDIAEDFAYIIQYVFVDKEMGHL